MLPVLYWAYFGAAAACARTDVLDFECVVVGVSVTMSCMRLQG